VDHDSGLVANGCKKYLDSITVSDFALENADQIAEWTVFYRHAIARLKLVSDSYQTIFSDAMLDNINDISVDRGRKATEADYTLNSPCETNLVKHVVHPESTEDVPGKQAFNRVI
jgi:hypothetical protein